MGLLRGTSAGDALSVERLHRGIRKRYGYYRPGTALGDGRAVCGIKKALRAVDAVRVLHIARYFLPHQGGEERYAHVLGRELVRLGHEMWVLTSSLPGCPKEEVMDGIRVLRSLTVVTLLRNPISPGMLLPRSFIRDFDLIHAQNEHSFSALAAVFLKRFYSLPLVTTCSGRLVFGKPLADCLERVYGRSMGRWVLNSSDAVIVLSRSERERLRRQGISPGKLKVIPTGVDPKKWEPYADKNPADWRKKHCLENKRVILYAGAITERKGVRYLIEALPLVLSTYPDSVCVLVGDGDFRVEAERLVREVGLQPYVRFTGRVSDEEMCLAYRGCDVYVLPSLSEGTPATLIEALMFAKPVVATDIDGIRDYFSEVVSTVPARNSESLAAAIKNVWAYPELARTRAQKGKELVGESFTLQHHVKKVVELYESVLLDYRRKQVCRRTEATT